jgi:hypothetical protein
MSSINAILIDFPKIFVDIHPHIGVGSSMLFHYFNFQEIDHSNFYALGLNLLLPDFPFQ